MTREEIMQLNTDYLNDCESEHEMNELFYYLLQLQEHEQQPCTNGYCKDCKYFEYDSMANVDGISLIVAHEICKRWGEGCKTKEDGYCFLYEPKEGDKK